MYWAAVLCQTLKWITHDLHPQGPHKLAGETEMQPTNSHLWVHSTWEVLQGGQSWTLPGETPQKRTCWWSRGGLISHGAETNEGKGATDRRPSVSRSSKVHSLPGLRFIAFKHCATGFETNPELFGGVRASLEWKHWEPCWQVRRVRRRRCLTLVCLKATKKNVPFLLLPNSAYSR